MEQTFRQLQFDRRLLTAFRTRLTRVVGWHLMEVFAIAFCDPVTPLKEHTPRRIRNGLGKMSVLYHVAWLEFLGDHNGIKSAVVKKFIRCFREKVKALTGNNIGLLRQCVLCLIPSSASVLFARQIPLKFRKFAFGSSVKTRIRCLFTLGSRQKIVCPNVHTTRRFRNTFRRIRHFANDKAIPAPRRLFQRDLFRVSDDSTMLADFHFTEFRDFQSVIPSACFTDRILTDTYRLFLCILGLFTKDFRIFSEFPCQRTDRTLISRIPLFLRTFATSALEMLVRGVNAFDRRHLHVLGVIGIVRSRSTEAFQMIDLIIYRHGFATIVPHLRTHLEHVVLQLLLMAQLRKKPLFLQTCWIRTKLKCHFHDFSRITLLSPFQWEASTPPSGDAETACQRDTSIKPQSAKNVKCFFKKNAMVSHTRADFPHPAKARGFPIHKL